MSFRIQQTLTKSLFLFATLFSNLLSFSAQCQELASWLLTDEEGLPSMTVYECLQDDLGYIWMGTANGICKYDGQSFKTFSHEILRDNEILKTRKDAWNRIWFVNLSGQLAYIEDDRVIPFLSDSILMGKRIVDIHIGETIMWLQYKEGFLNYHLYEEEQPVFNKQIIGTYTNNRSIRIKKDTLSFVHEPKGIYLALHSFGVDKENEKRLFQKKEIKTPSADDHFSEYVFTTLNPKNGFPKIMALANDRLIELAAFDHAVKITNLKVIDSICWITSTTDLWNIPVVPKSTPIVPVNILKNINANDITKDREGNYWITTTSQGVRSISSLGVQLMNTVEGSLPNNEVHRLYYDPLQNQVISGHSDGKIVIHQPGKSPWVLDLEMKGRVLDIIQNHQGDFYCAIDGGIVVLDRQLKNRFSYIDLKGIKTIMEDSQQRSWFGSSNRIEFTEGILTPSIQKKCTVLNKRTYAVQEDALQNIWFGTLEGLYFFQDKVSPYLENNRHQKYYVTSFTQSPDSILWVSTKSNGILGIKNKETVYRFDTENGLVSNQCKRLFWEDSVLWIATNKGLNYLDYPSKTIGLINKKDGLPSNEIYDVLIAKEEVWVATPKGIAHFPKNLSHHNQMPPPVYLTALDIWEKDQPLDTSIQLQYHQNNFQFDFIGLGFKAKNAISYKYKMTGIDQDWIYTKNTFARYPVVNPGNYRFEVYAINEDGVESLRAASISISVALAWWQTWWLKIGALLLLLGALFVGLQNHFRKREERRRIQDQINQLKQQALQAQMNPHFIFNVLAAIQNSLMTNQQEKAILYLSNFSKLIRSIFNDSQKKEISLEKEIQFLKHYFSLEKLRFGSKVKIDLLIDPGLEEELTVIKIPPLLLQPLVENAFKHGLFHKGKGGHLQLHFSRKKEWLQFTIEDNGVGRVAAQKINKSNGYDQYHHSSGISTIEKRLQIVNQKHEPSFRTALHIEDLYHQGKATGTRIIVSIYCPNFN